MIIILTTGVRDNRDKVFLFLLYPLDRMSNLSN